LVFAVATPRAAETTHLKIIVGVTDDTAKWMVRQDGIVGVHKDLRLMAVRVTVPWRGQAKPSPLQEVYLQRIRRMTQLNERIVLAVYNEAEYAPTTRAARNRYCGFLRHFVKRVPLIHDVEVWNEANSPTYWPQSAGAASYLDGVETRPGELHLRDRRCLSRAGTQALALRHLRPQSVPRELGRAAVGHAPRLGPDRAGRLRDLDERLAHGIRRNAAAGARE
jgi:hypothetical protein